MTKRQIIISVIIPVYNSQKYIADSINSVLKQTLNELEIIIINDCSNDNSLSIIERVIENTNHKIILKNLKKNQGQGYCRNLGLSLARGKYIAFLDSDDIWEKNKLSAQLDFMQKNNYLFSFTNISFINEFNKIIKNKLLLTKNHVDYNSLLFNNYIPTSTVVISRELISKYQFTDYRKKQDYIMWLEILKKEKIAAEFLNETLTRYRKHDNQVTGKKFKLIRLHYEILRKNENLNITLSILYTITWGLFGIYKHYIKNE